MIVIALCGSANTGKTCTLRLLIKNLIKAGSTVLDPENMKDLDKLSDIRCCLKTKLDKKVCITTPGDNKKIQDENLLYVSKIHDVDLWITASRNYGQSVEEIWHSGILDINQVIWVEKTSCISIYKHIKGQRDNPIYIESDLTKEADFEACNIFDLGRIVRIIDKYC